MLKVNLFFQTVCLSTAITGAVRTDRAPPQSIAVIGAGIGGSSSAYFLRQHFGRGVRIDVFESETVGGRLATASINGQDYETGGSTIHPFNLHMKKFAQMLGLQELKLPDDVQAVYDGKEFVFEDSDWFIINIIKLVWRYGFDYLRMKMWVESYMHRFMKIYQFQSGGYSFTTMEKLLYGVGGDEFVRMIKYSIDEALQNVGIGQRFLNEIVTPILRLSSGQSVNINALVGTLSLLQADSDLWRVEGGNKLVCSGLLYSAKVNLIKGEVTSIRTKRRPQHNGELVHLYEVNYIEGSVPGYSLYDIVILAAPLYPGKSQVHFHDIPQPISFHSGRYQQKVVTLVAGCLNASYFGQHDSGPFRPTTITTTAHSDGSILGASVSAPVKPVPSDQPPTCARVWKVLSSEPLAEGELSRLFPSPEAVHESRWFAHPSYSSSDEIPPFVLHDHLYHLNAMEWAASTMEMMAISAKNAALLARHRWYQQLEKIDQDILPQGQKVEL
ncbi:prenylcysteine oxidase 1-like [Cetorhinus maximus]